MHINVPGPESTGETVRIAIQEAIKRQISHIVTASNTGFTAFALAEEARKQGYEGKLICVPHAYGIKEAGKNELSDENRKKLEDLGVAVYFASHVLSGAERHLMLKFQGVYPVEIIAYALRMLSAGVKVGVEVSVMVLDAGLIPYGKPVIALGGSHKGADTATILTPSHGRSLLDTRIHEILCKPF